MQTFVQEIPAGTGAAYVVVVHLEPTHASELADILARKAHIPVQQVNTDVHLKPDNIYVIPPNRRLLVTGHRVATSPFDEPRGRRSPIDQFFRSLSDLHGDGFAVILTGAGSDGSLGAKAIKEAGGFILVQDPREAEYPSMPRSAIATGYADIVLPLRELGRQLIELLQTKAIVPSQKPGSNDEETLKRILTHLRARTGHDFGRYKRSTIYRRLTRRMQIQKIESFEDYLLFIKQKPEEAQSLFHDLLISVTTFFRDGSPFEALAKEVIPKLFDEEESAGPIRVWVPGCATGEEAYSVAILFAEEAARREVRTELQLFASDLDAHALSIAREGKYPLAIEADVGEDRIKRYFTRGTDHFRIRREIRDMVLFASHSLLKDPPFSRLNLISCRNLLIYLEKDLQQQVITTFNYALKPRGYLFLGSSESADSPQGFFHPVDREARLYQSKNPPGDRRDYPQVFVPPRNGEVPVLNALPQFAAPAPPASHQRALELAAPPSILVDSNHHVVNMSEGAGRFIQPSGGQIRNDIAELVRPELRFDLRTALHRAFERNQPTLSLPIAVRFNGDFHTVILQVRPVSQEREGPRQALVFFLEGGPAGDATTGAVQTALDQASGETILRLKEELELTRIRLRASREEFEAANEELRAANEELQSINEEYRSTAEELETSKEELQSINEELQTVNAELKVKLEGVSQTNNDLQNLMAATDVGTLFLDSQLRIKRFTPRMTELFNIKAADEGRSITDFTHRLDYPQFTADAQTVLKDLTIVEREIGGNGSWYLTRLRPYRTLDDRIDGVVCTFVDVTERRKIQDALATSEARLRLLLGELSHRVKNTLAVVQSMARQSFAVDIPRDEALEAFSNRLRALAEAHNQLVSSNWHGADFRELAQGQMRLYEPAGDKRIVMQGPPAAMPPSVATPLALILHELATNALKYGALSSPDGTVRLDWGFNGDAEKKKEFFFSWRELGGPAVQNPAREGFGSWLIRHGLGDAKVELNFPPAGIICTVAVPAEILEGK